MEEYQTELTTKTTATETSQFNNAPDESQMSTIKAKGEGDIQVFKRKGVPCAFMWKGAENKWEFVGEVVDPNAGQSDNNMGMMPNTVQYPGDHVFEAGEYDYVFDVEMGDGIHRKLPFNNGANSLIAAELFCMREQIGKGHVGTI